jgi:hypothetical protein
MVHLIKLTEVAASVNDFTSVTSVTMSQAYRPHISVNVTQELLRPREAATSWDLI